MAERLSKRRRSSRSTDSEEKSIKSEDPVLVVLESDEDVSTKPSAVQHDQKGPSLPCSSTPKPDESVINYELVKSQLRAALGTEDNRLSSRDRAQISFLCDIADEKLSLSVRLIKRVNEELTMFYYVLEYGWAKTLAYLRGVRRSDHRVDWRKGYQKSHRNSKYEAARAINRNQQLEFLPNGLPSLGPRWAETKSEKDSDGSENDSANNIKPLQRNFAAMSTSKPVKYYSRGRQ